MYVGGETIRQLQVQCGAHIELHRGTHPNAHEKLFNIRGNNRCVEVVVIIVGLLSYVGNPQEIAHAQQLLKEKIEVTEYVRTYYVVIVYDTEK